MRRIFLCLLVFMTLVAAGQPPARFYVKYGGGGSDIGYSIAEAEGKKYVIGGSTSSFASETTDMYLMLIDSMGNKIWDKTFGGIGLDICKKVIFNPVDKGFILGGFTTSYGQGGYDIIIVRTDQKGEIIWQKSYGGLDWDFLSDMCLTDDGNVVVCGKTYNYHYGDADGWLYKFDIVNGDILWERFYGGVNSDELNAIVTKPGLDLYVAGTTKSMGDVNGDMLFLRVTQNGDSVTSFTYGGLLYDGCRSVVLNDTNEIFLAGGSESYTNGKRDALFVKFDKNGNFVWRKNYGISGEDEECFKIIHSATRGYSENTAIYTTKEFPATNKDIKTIYLESNGDFFGFHNSGKFGGGLDDEAFDIIATSDRGYIQVGYTKSFGSEMEDVFIVKQDSLLDEGWGTMDVTIREHLKENADITVAPNPAKKFDGLTIWFPPLTRPQSLEIHHLGGGLQFKTNNLHEKDEELLIDLTLFDPGVYIIKIRTVEKTICKKLVVCLD